MTVDAHGVVLAIRSMIDLTECDRCLLAIEEDKTTAIANLRHALANLPYDNSAKTRVPIELTTITPIYPSGAERVLIHRLTGHNAGIVCLNVATIHAAWQAQQGYAMTSRIITIAGSQAHNPCNVRVHLGTSIEQILQATGNTVNTAQHRVRAGGPLSGFDLIDLDVPVTATTNCIAIEAQREAKPAQPCIRCGECSDVCPASLLPQQLYWYAQTNEIEQANRFGLNQCIECGCCDLVCPSQIPLTQSFRHSKAIARQQLIETKAANDAKQRFEQRQIRLDRIAQEQASQRERQKRTLQEEKDDMAQSLERARLRRKQRGNRDNPSLDSDNKSTSQATQASKTQGNPTGNNSS